MTAQEHKAAVKLIDHTFMRLTNVMTACEREWQQYLEQVRIEEKDHRRFCPDHIQCGLPLSKAVKQFAVMEVFRFMNGDKAPAPEDLFRYRRSIFMAYALYWMQATALAKEFTSDDVMGFLSLDYAKLNKDPRTWND